MLGLTKKKFIGYWSTIGVCGIAFLEALPSSRKVSVCVCVYFLCAFFVCIVESLQDKSSKLMVSNDDVGGSMFLINKKSVSSYKKDQLDWQTKKGQGQSVRVHLKRFYCDAMLTRITMDCLMLQHRCAKITVHTR